jgi:hypothetical protein
MSVKSKFGPQLWLKSDKNNKMGENMSLDRNCGPLCPLWLDFILGVAHFKPDWATSTPASQISLKTRLVNY